MLLVCDVDEYGFQRPEDFDYLVYEKFMSSYLKVLTERQIRWETLKRKNTDFSKLTRTLKRYIRKGIPTSYRTEVWMKVSGAYQNQQQSPDLYSNLLRAQFDRDTVEAIKIDLPRTFPDNIHFETKKRQLFNVLIAYAHHNRDVGYCQGLNYIAGLLLIVTQKEEPTFWLLKMIVEKIVPSYHTKRMTNLIRDLAVLKELIKLKVPEVNNHIENLGLPYTVIASKWFVCLFAEVLPTETVLRIWDCVFAEGYKILFRVGITLIVAHRNVILQADDISVLAELFRNEIIKGEIATDCHNFMKNIFKVPGNLKRRDLERLRLICIDRTNC
ncbi:growth hormone-regulated TBC protein 1 isoform X2 [Hermetia illucens]|uniref:growth hormone-regulated TBC protein 1 isoform X2 n=1 Tax=Hermetia illucens TaxID=343691 RepID=UPI0018CC192B|nr:growth hormone-regulated TBC protein 1 isoform X2 [Hermetia illucens]